jgi:hypothetical protein
VEFTRKYVVDLLHKAGFREMADEALRDLPDPVDREQVTEWAAAHGVYWDEVMSRMGGSP